MSDMVRDPRSRFWEGRWAGAAVVAIVLGVYAPTLVFGRVDYDDTWLWADNSPLRDLSSSTLHDVFFELDAAARHPLGGDYAPVRDLSVAADMAIWGDNEHGPHATQLALFALSVFGLGALLIRFGFTRPVAWLGVLAWAIHPMRVEAVAWLSDRKDVLAGLFVIACGHAWVRYRTSSKPGWLVVGTLATVAGTWCKGPAMFAPAAFAALDLLLLAPGRRRWIASAVICAAAALAAIPAVLVGRDARIIGTTDAPSPGRAISSLGAQGHYVESLVLARPVSTNYPIQTRGPSGVDLAVGACALLGSLALVWWWRRRADRRPALALLAWTWIWFVPIGQLLIPVHIVVADRYAYLWAVGPLVAIALLIEALPRVARFATSGVLICVLAILTLRAEGAWTSSIELFAHALASNPYDPLAYRSLAMPLYVEGRTREALATLDRGLSDHPDHVKLLLSKAYILEHTDHLAEAFAIVRRTAETGAASAMWTYAQMLDADHRPDEALQWAERAAAKHPEISDYILTDAAIRRELAR